MSWYEKKILYLACYNGEEKGPSAGFAEFRKQRDEMILRLQLKGMPKEIQEEIQEEMKVWVLTEQKDINAGTIFFRQGKEKAEKSFVIKGDKLLVGKEEVREEEFTGIRLPLDGKQGIAGYLRRKEPEGRRPDEETLLHQSELPVQVQEEQRTYAAYAVSADKWGELQRHYPVIHPFGDDRIFVRIELKDFVIFHSSCQKLVNNSFLLHGFYNYRHLILGPDRELGGDGESCFYLGVPGTYFEREKMVAVMFGFEGFECEGSVEIGKLGYYMRRVEL